MKPLLLVILLALVCVLPLWGQGEAENELLKLEDDWGNAWVKGDTGFLGQLLAPDYTGVMLDGAVLDKAQQIKHNTPSDETDKSFKFSDRKARVYGETGVVVGRMDATFTKGGKEHQVAYTYTNVFMKRDGRWQVVASQATALPKQAATGSAKSAKPEKK